MGTTISTKSCPSCVEMPRCSLTRCALLRRPFKTVPPFAPSVTTDNSTVVSADTSTVSPDTGAHTQMAYFLLVVGAAGAVCCVVALTRKKKVQD
ncbi:MAG: hypothetical protein KH282_06360 [Clostridiales bacterium]|nr:hypothetical protein [Clostridiales bacterium]